MSFDKNNFKYSIVDNIDYTIEEQGNQFTALRKNILILEDGELVLMVKKFLLKDVLL